MRLLGLTVSEASTFGLLVSSSIWGIAARVAGTAATFIVGILLARFLTPAGLGVYAVVMGVAALLISAAQFGLPTLALREVSLARARLDWSGLSNVIFWFSLISGGLGVVLGATISLIMMLNSDASEQLKATSYWGALLVPIMALTLLVSAKLRAFDRLLIGQTLEILVRPVCVALLLVSFYLLSSGDISPARAMAANTVGSALALLLGAAWLTCQIPRPGHRQRREPPLSTWVKPASLLMLTDVLRTLEGTYAILIIGALGTAAEVGIFKVAAASAIPMAIPLLVLDNVLPPTLARLYAAGDKKNLQRVLSAAACFTVATTSAGALAIAFMGGWLINVLFGPEYADSWQPLLLLSLGWVVMGFFGVGTYMLAMCGGEKQLACCYVGSVAAGIVTAIPLGFYWGISGVALSVVIGILVNNFAVWSCVRGRTGLDTSVLSVVCLIAEQLGRSARRF